MCVPPKIEMGGCDDVKVSPIDGIGGGFGNTGPAFVDNVGARLVDILRLLTRPRL